MVTVEEIPLMALLTGYADGTIREIVGPVTVGAQQRFYGKTNARASPISTSQAGVSYKVVYAVVP